MYKSSITKWSTGIVDYVECNFRVEDVEKCESSLKESCDSMVELVQSANSHCNKMIGNAATEVSNADNISNEAARKSFEDSATAPDDTPPDIFVPTVLPKWRKFLHYVGPGALVAVGYMDPGDSICVATGLFLRSLSLTSPLSLSFVFVLVQVTGLRTSPGGVPTVIRFFS